MSIARIVRDRVAGTSGSLASRARQRRWGRMLSVFPDLAGLSVVDLGGTVSFWETAPIRPRALTVLNLQASGSGEVDVEEVVGDACCAPSVLGGRRFDLVFSNSTIEHLGGHSRFQEFAQSVHALAGRHWIQTPYRYFPIEPHYVGPGFQFLPVAVRGRILARWPLSYAQSRGLGIDDPVGTALSTELLGISQLRYYFPTSEVISERIVGVTKSIIAVRR